MQNRLVTLYDMLDTEKRAYARLARLKAQAEEAMKVDRKNLDEYLQKCAAYNAREEKKRREEEEAAGMRRQKLAADDPYDDAAQQKKCADAAEQETDARSPMPV